jgi:hypothetical protein
VHHRENQEIVARIAAKWRRSRHLSERDQRRLMIALQRMRMSCESSYLLDEQSDHGTKAGEILTFLGEIFEEPGTKVVIFSQWLRMHEILAKRIAAAGWGYVLFHGGIDSRARAKLIDRFRDDPECRIFLSTDAGGVGLNLQHASVVMSVDLPWNPAVLEQRVGRVHRIGQRAPVRVVNFVAEGTIEQGMLSVLRFKKSLFAGVLDGGETEVFLGKGRLDRFMESIERVTAEIQPVPVAAETPADVSLPEPSVPGAGATALVEPLVDPLARLLVVTVIGNTRARSGAAISMRLTASRVTTPCSSFGVCSGGGGRIFTDSMSEWTSTGALLVTAGARSPDSVRPAIRVP